MKNVYLLVALLFASMLVSAQESSKVSITSGVDFYNRYVWRGLLFSDSPNIQPYVNFSAGNFSAMAWGSYATSKNYAEIDLFLSYSINNLTLSLNDYYTEDEADLSLNDYDNWDKEVTPHLVEACLTYSFPSEKFPLTLLASTFVYGSLDLNAEMNQNYSTYFEARYPFSVEEYDLSIALGGTIDGGYYAEEASLVNLTLDVSKSLKITESFSVPIKTSLTYHPYNKDLFMTIGFSL